MDRGKSLSWVIEWLVSNCKIITVIFRQMTVWSLILNGGLLWNTNSFFLIFVRPKIMSKMDRNYGVWWQYDFCGLYKCKIITVSGEVDEFPEFNKNEVYEDYW